MTEFKPSSQKWEDWSQEVLKQLINLNNYADNLKKDNESLKETVSRLEQTLNNKFDDMHEMVSGNGDPAKGLIMRVAFLEKSKTETEEYIKSEKEKSAWILKTTIGACLTAIASLIVTIAKFFFFKGQSQ